MTQERGAAGVPGEHTMPMGLPVQRKSGGSATSPEPDKRTAQRGLNPERRLHSVDNFYVARCSVFATSAMPTRP
jgi:hypothetical protein